MSWVLHAIHEPAYIEDSAGRIIACNLRLQQLVGHFGEPALLGQTIEALGLRLEPKGCWRAERGPLQNPEGEPCYLVQLYPLEAPSSEEEASTTTDGLRERVSRLVRERSVQQIQKLDSLGQLTGGIAHDFNNLLAVITGCIELLKVKAGPNQPVLELADRALTAAERGAILIQRLLAFSKREQFNPTTTQIDQLIHETLELTRRSVGEPIEIETHLASSPWQTLVDISQLENAILNLVLNARDAMPEGGILMLSTSQLSLPGQATSALLEPKEPHRAFPLAVHELPAGDYIRISVSDTGTGIPPELLEQVFEPFFTTKQAGGSGLGLAMVFGFVNQAGGSLRVVSEVNVGTSVELYLPRAQFGQNQAKFIDLDTPRGRGELVLVTEDDPAVRGTVLAILAELGYEALEAASAAEAFDLIRKHPSIELLLTDVVLGATANGPELASLALKKLPGLKIVFMTGYADEHLGLSDKSTKILKKPFRAPELARILREALGRS